MGKMTNSIEDLQHFFILVSFRCYKKTGYYKISNIINNTVKQHIFIISQSCRSEVQHRSHWAKIKVSPELFVSGGCQENLCLAHSVCRKDSVPCGHKNEVPISLPTAMGRAVYLDSALTLCPVILVLSLQTSRRWAKLPSRHWDTETTVSAKFFFWPCALKGPYDFIQLFWLIQDYLYFKVYNLIPSVKSF